MATISSGLEARLARNLSWKGDCLIWTGATHRGYGRIYDGTSVKKRVHRVVYSMVNGPIPENLEVRHTCDNPPCCNPEHLILGTHKENMEDMSSRNRVVALKGEEHVYAKLTETQVLQIRERYATTSITQKQLALEYNVAPQTVHSVIHRRTWKHI